MTLGKRIMKNRKRLGLTQDQLAEKLGVTAQAVSKWENDQSCPDISMLPKLSEIFGISTDELLGREPEAPVYEGQVETPGRAYISWGSEKTAGLYFALLIICLGGLLLASSLLHWELSFWTMLWTSALTLFGIFGLFPRFSFSRLCCALVGLYCLISNIVPMPEVLQGSTLTAVLMLLCGLCLLADLLWGRHRRPAVEVEYRGGEKTRGDFRTDGDSFRFSASFGSRRQYVQMARLQQGRISTSFGEYTVDLSGVRELAPGACIQAECSFGELTLLMPRRFSVRSKSSSAFASVDIAGTPEENPEGEITLEASASFGEIRIQYI